MTSVLVTGASGFIGRSLVRSLRQFGISVVEVDWRHGDLADATTWTSLPSAEHVVHLAGRSFVPNSWQNPAAFYATNTLGAAHAIDFCRRSGAHLVFVSGYAYGVPQRLPIDETHPLDPNNPYALSKAMAERICAFHSQKERVPVTIVRPFNIYGPGQRHAFLIPTVLDQITSGQSIRVDDLAPRRDYLFIDDLNDGLRRTLETPGGLRIYNFGSGVSVSVREIIDLAQTIAGTDLPVICENRQRDHEIMDVRSDVTRAQVELGWQPRISLRDGLAAILRSAQVSVY